MPSAPTMTQSPCKSAPFSGRSRSRAASLQAGGHRFDPGRLHWEVRASEQFLRRLVARSGPLLECVLKFCSSSPPDCGALARRECTGRRRRDCRQDDHARVLVGVEQASELAAAHAGADVDRVASVFEQVRVDVERCGQPARASLGLLRQIRSREVEWPRAATVGYDRMLAAQPVLQGQSDLNGCWHRGSR
jgi:hypothetical protein